MCSNNKNALLAYPELRNSITHSDRGTNYTSALYQKEINKNKIVQSINSDDGKCHDNAHIKSMRARMKSKLLYDRYNTDEMPVIEVIVLIWRYFTTNRGLPPAVKRKQYYDALKGIE